MTDYVSKKFVVYLILSKNVWNYSLWMWRLYTGCQAVPCQLSYVMWVCGLFSEYDDECDFITDIFLS